MNTLSRIIICLFFSGLLNAQTTLTQPIDAAVLSLGESSVATTVGVFPIDINPASLAYEHSLRIFYTNRSFDALVSDLYIHAFGLSIPTHYGVFSIAYKRLNWTEISFYTSDFPEGPRSSAIFREYTAFLSGSIPLGEHFSAGLNAKLFDSGLVDFKGTGEHESTTPAYLFDVGIQFRKNQFLGTSENPDQLSFGFSLQNIGSNFEKRQGFGQPDYNVSYQPPRFLRVGFSYMVSHKEQEDFSGARFLLTGEYRTTLNEERLFFRAAELWGAGLEVRILQTVFVRGGGKIQPYDDDFGRNGRFNWRYGAGMYVPFKKIGIDFPVSFAFDICVLPLNVSENIFQNSQKSIVVYGIQVSWEDFAF